MKSGEVSVTRKDIIRDLRKIGLRAGDIVELHLSLKSIGYVEGGPKTVIRAFQEVLGKRGALLMPAFSYCFDKSEVAFHPDETPVNRKIGWVAETFRKLPGVVRSLCPIHSVAAWGRHAVEFTYRHPISTTLGIGSPFHRAAQAGGKIILLGCNHNANSFLHVTESLTRHPMLHDVSPYGAKCGLIKQEDGKIKKMELTEYTGCSDNFQKIQGYLDRHHLLTHGSVGHAPVQIMIANELIKRLVPLLKRYPEYLLCPPGCKASDRRREYIMNRRKQSKRYVPSWKGSRNA